MTRPALLAALATLIGVTFQPPAGDRNVAGVSPSVGEECRIVHRYPVTFTDDAGGGWRATFAFAGGAARGSLPVSEDDATRIAGRTAYVTDVQLGSYEPAHQTDGHGPLACRLEPTFHFYCPATGVLDRLCYTWVSGSPTGVSGGAGS